MYNYTMTTTASLVLKGIVLRWYRELRFLTQQEVAKRVGISKIYLSFLESGKRRLTNEMQMRIVEAIDSLEDRTREGMIEFAINQINFKVFYDPSGGEYRWQGSYSNGSAVFIADKIRVEISRSVTKQEELTVRKTGKPLVSGRIRVDLPNDTRVRYFLLYKSKVEASLEDFGDYNGPKVADLLAELKRMLTLFWEVKPNTLARQIDEILKAK